MQGRGFFRIGLVGAISRTLAGSLILLATACGIVSKEPVFTLRTVALESVVDTNRNKPVSVDLLIIYDSSMINAVAALTANDWFRRKAQFDKDFPNGFAVLGWEMVPDNTIPTIALADEELESPDGAPARAGFIFALYDTPGEHRARLETQTGVRVLLGRDTFTLESIAQEE